MLVDKILMKITTNDDTVNTALSPNEEQYYSFENKIQQPEIIFYFFIKPE